MALIDLVEYFNDRFEREHKANYRPMIIENNQVIGLFGQLNVGSIFSSLRDASNPKTISGHAVKMKVSACESPHLHSYEIENLAANLDESSGSNFESAINFDRLARTVHALNYLPLAEAGNPLFLEVDPRHILGIKKDHGAYFETIIEQCGLTVKNTVIVLAVSGGSYLTYRDALIRGLTNYRQRGYQIALRFNQLIADQHASELINKLSPNYVSLSASQMQEDSANKALKKLHTLKKILISIEGKGILRQIDCEASQFLASDSGFDLVEGRYYDNFNA